MDEIQDIVDRMVVRKAVIDALTSELKDLQQEYLELRTSDGGMPKGDNSQYGEVTFCYNKPTDSEVVTRFVVNDPEALKADDSEDFAESLRRYHERDLPKYAEEHFYETGEVLDGCEVQTEVIPAKPRTFRNLMVKPDKATKQRAIESVSGIAGLLGGE